MSDIDALVAFVEARLSDGERMATATDLHGSSIQEDGLFDGTGIVVANLSLGRSACAPLPSHVATFIAHYDPQWALDDAAGVRRLIKRYRNALAVGPSINGFVRGQDDGYRQACRDALLDVAWRYRRHPDWQPEWAPEGAVDE